MADLTPEAREGYFASPHESCPYIGTSDSFRAWNVGRHMKAQGFGEPKTGNGMADRRRNVVANGRANVVTLRGYRAALLATFHVDPDGEVKQAR